MVADAEHLLEHGDRSAVPVHERMPGVRVLLHVVRHAQRGQRTGQPAGRTAQRDVPPSVAADHRAGPLEDLLGPARQRPVVGRGRVEAPGRGEQREAPAHAEADDADPPRAVRPGCQPCAGGLEVAEGRALPTRQRTERRPQAPHRAARGEQVRRDGQVARGRQPVGLVPGVVGEPEDLVHDHDRGPGALADRRDGEVRAQLRCARAPGHADVRHGSPPVATTDRGGRLRTAARRVSLAQDAPTGISVPAPDGGAAQGGAAVLPSRPS